MTVKSSVNCRNFVNVDLVSDSIGESVGADQEADEMEKNDNLDPIEISEMENGGMEPDDDPTDGDSSDTDGGSDGGEVSLARFSYFSSLVHSDFLRECYCLKLGEFELQVLNPNFKW